MTERSILSTHSAPEGHWVGDGFPVKSILSPQYGRDISPFLLFDHAGPADFEPATTPRGVDVHPHKGFETVTIVFEGELEHRDSGGNAGSIGPGDVQWMTAGSGVLHEEKHSEAFTKRGGRFHVVQLWVNLLAADKLSAPGYQTLLAKDIPTASLGGGSARVIAGSLDGVMGPAKTFTPMNVWDVDLNGTVEMEVPTSHNAMVIVLSGSASVGDETLGVGELVLFGRDGDGISLSGEGKVIVLTGEPIDEPVAAHGPFVMNTPEEIRETIAEYQSGKFGSL
ncbi:MAG: pirin family protein [Armatimonadota bacterium]|nr:pirin family protein [Armatimonadota bacterium]